MWYLLPIAALSALGGLAWYRHHPRPFPVSWTAMLDWRVRRWILVPERFAASLPLPPQARVLEIGPGGGAITVALLAHRSRPVLICLDMQLAMLRRVRARFVSPGQREPLVVCGQGSAIPLAGASIDCVALVTVLGEIPDRMEALRECARVLRPGGLLAIAETLPDPDFLTRQVLLRETTAAGFDVSGGPLATGTLVGTWAAYAQQFRRRDAT